MNASEIGQNIKGFWFHFGCVKRIYFAILNSNQMNLFVENAVTLFTKQ